MPGASGARRGSSGVAAAGGVGRMVHISAIGADPEAESDYARTKGEGEAAVRAAFPGAVILRPSVIFGPEDGFFNRFGAMAAKSPVLPLVGANTRFQPVFVDDVAAAAEAGVTGSAQPGTYELGGPDQETFRDLMQRLLATVQRRRLILGLPFWVGRIMGSVFDGLQTMTLGLFQNSVITRDQVLSLASDNVVAEDAKGLADLGIEPTAMGAVIEGYLWRFRPSGQYDAIKDSAKNLKV